MKTLPIVLAMCFFGICTSQEKATPATNDVSTFTVTEEDSSPRPLPKIEKLGSGSYLSSRFAQDNHDWKSANTYIAGLLNSDQAAGEITRRAMILAMGAGDHEKAVELAKKIMKDPKDPSLSVAQIFLIADAMAKDDTKTADALISSLPQDTTAKFVRPFLEGWNSAAAGKLNIQSLNENTIQLYHAILISDFLNDHTQLEKILNKNIIKQDADPADMERIADLYAHAGLKDGAIKLYKEIQKESPENEGLQKKIDDVKNGTNKPLFEKVSSAKAGMAGAFHDIAQVLFQDLNDESARIFANLALLLNPGMTENKFLLAQISARHNQQEDAISYYKSIPENDENYTNAQLKISEILEDSGKPDEALTVLETLKKKDDSVSIEINIGDFQRRQKDYQKALNAYNAVITKLGSTVSPDYWGIYYARGICYEQLGDWPSAEKELKTALDLQPDHPYVLNYLGYGWADKGMHLDEALQMIQKAADLRPDDGYIVDSLGWVMYRLGNFTDAVPNLEKAADLLPYDPTINDHLGDSYWKVGRHREARFQWMRAKNFAEDKKQIEDLDKKLVSGLSDGAQVADTNKPH